MPVDRHGQVPTADDEMSIYEPGAYRHALERKCHQDAEAAAANYLLLETDAELAAWHEANAERKATLIAERNGKPITVRASMLPQGLHAPFERWSRQQRRFRVDPDGRITLLPRKIPNAS